MKWIENDSRSARLPHEPLPQEVGVPAILRFYLLTVSSDTITTTISAYIAT